MIPLVVQLLLVLFYPSVHAGLTDLCGLKNSPIMKSKRRFYIYWNVPTFMCHKYGINFEEVREFNILQNTNDTFRGNVIAILYDPGDFPAMVPLEHSSQKDKYKRRNGGVPQMGRYDRHKAAFTENVKDNIPNVDFSGVGVIDFEMWKPIFRQNWGDTKIHRDLSIELVKKVHPLWNRAIVEAEATNRFEKHGRFFMEETLKLAKTLRPKADWGYYGYPYCYNLSPGNPGFECNSKTMSENDKISWLFKNQEVLLPSVYVKYFLKPVERAGLVEGRVKEAVRISNNLKHRPRVLPYWWYKYTDQMDVYLSEKDVQNTFREILFNNGEGIIIWGSSNDVATAKKCRSLRRYLKTLLGPIASKILRAANDGVPLDF